MDFINSIYVNNIGTAKAKIKIPIYKFSFKNIHKKLGDLYV